MNSIYKQICNYSLSTLNNSTKLRCIPMAGIKNFVVPSYDDVELPEDVLKRRLRFVDKVPQMIGPGRAPRMNKCLRLIRGEEEVQIDLLYKQYGIIAVTGGYITHAHMEVIRMGLYREIDTRRMFAIWRIESPWFPRTKKGQGKRMGGGKGNISHYTVPVKGKRVIMELGGKCSFEEVKSMLTKVANKLPFPAKVVSQETLMQEREEDRRIEEENINKYTFRYLAQNKMQGCDKWIKPFDAKYNGKCA